MADKSDCTSEDVSDAPELDPQIIKLKTALETEFTIFLSTTLQNLTLPFTSVEPIIMILTTVLTPLTWATAK